MTNPPILITLAQIKAKNPCRDGWEKILEARGGPSAVYDKPFPLAEALESNSLDDVLWALRCLPEHGSLWRKLAVYYARRVVHLAKPEDRPFLEATLEVAWRHSEGQATDEELERARSRAFDATSAAVANAAVANAAVAVANAAYAYAAVANANAAYAAYVVAYVVAAERTAQKAKLKQILEAGHWVED